MLEAFEKSPRRAAAGAAAPPADSVCESLHLAQAAGFRCTAVSDMAQRVVLRTIGREQPSLSPAGPAIVALIENIGAPLFTLGMLSL